MDADEHTVDFLCDISGGSLGHTLGHGGNGCSQGFAFDMNNVAFWEDFLCIPLAHFDRTNEKYKAHNIAEVI